MKKFPLILAGGLLAVALPALAHMHGEDRGGMGGMHDMKAPSTRTEVEAAVRSHFTMMDANKDGQVTQAEIQSMQAAHRAERQDAHFKAMDKDGNGQISKGEFDAAHNGELSKADDNGAGHHGGSGRMKHEGHEGAQQGPRGMMGDGSMFTMADANKDGSVSLSEALSARLARFDAADSDKNGTLSPEERMKARQARKMEHKAQ
jgi:hypothetical protein